MTPTEAGQVIGTIKRIIMTRESLPQPRAIDDRLWAISARNAVVQALEYANGADLLEGIIVNQILAEAIAKGS